MTNSHHTSISYLEFFSTFILHPSVWALLSNLAICPFDFLSLWDFLFVNFSFWMPQERICIIYFLWHSPSSLTFIYKLHKHFWFFWPYFSLVWPPTLVMPVNSQKGLKNTLILAGKEDVGSEERENKGKGQISDRQRIMSSTMIREAYWCRGENN